MLFLLPFGFFGGAASVLCVGADGHVAIEAGLNGSCKGAPCGDHGHEGEEDSHHDHEGCGHESDCCGDCQDVALNLEDGTPTQVAAELDTALIFVAWLAVEIESPDGFFTSRFVPDRRQPPGYGPPLDSIRTVRLLI